MSLCGEGGAALCWECEMVPYRAIHHHATYLRLLLGGLRGGAVWGGRRGGLPTQAQLEEGQELNPHRSRGEALVRLSIPNLLRCLEFFFPDRRYLCRASQGFPFLRGGKLPYRNCRGGGRRPVLGWLVHCHFQLQLTGIRRTLLTLPRFPWVYFDRPRRGIKRKQKKPYLCTL